MEEFGAEGQAHKMGSQMPPTRRLTVGFGHAENQGCPIPVLESPNPACFYTLSSSNALDSIDQDRHQASAKLADELK